MHRSVKRPNLKQAFLFGLIAAGAVGCAEAPVVQAPVVYPDEAQGSAKFCVTPQEMDSLMIAGVKSRFMVAALACNGKTGFNAFINKNRPALLAAEKVTTGYFSKHYGRAAMSMQDEYITNLANAQSQRRLRNNTAFCQDTLKVMDDAQSISSSADLIAFAKKYPAPQPTHFSICGG